MTQRIHQSPTICPSKFYVALMQSQKKQQCLDIATYLELSFPSLKEIKRLAYQQKLHAELKPEAYYFIYVALRSGLNPAQYLRYAPTIGEESSESTRGLLQLCEFLEGVPSIRYRPTSAQIPSSSPLKGNFRYFLAPILLSFDQLLPPDTHDAPGNEDALFPKLKATPFSSRFEERSLLEINLSSSQATLYVMPPSPFYRSLLLNCPTWSTHFLDPYILPKIKSQFFLSQLQKLLASQRLERKWTASFLQKWDPDISLPSLSGKISREQWTTWIQGIVDHPEYAEHFKEFTASLAVDASRLTDWLFVTSFFEPPKKPFTFDPERNYCVTLEEALHLTDYFPDHFRVHFLGGELHNWEHQQPMHSFLHLLPPQTYQSLTHATPIPDVLKTIIHASKEATFSVLPGKGQEIWTYFNQLLPAAHELPLRDSPSQTQHTIQPKHNETPSEQVVDAPSLNHEWKESVWRLNAYEAASLIQCPYRFIAQKKGLYFYRNLDALEPLDVLKKGSLYHWIAEKMLREHLDAIFQGEGLEAIQKLVHNRYASATAEKTILEASLLDVWPKWLKFIQKHFDPDTTFYPERRGTCLLKEFDLHARMDLLAVTKQKALILDFKTKSHPRGRSLEHFGDHAQLVFYLAVLLLQQKEQEAPAPHFESVELGYYSFVKGEYFSVHSGLSLSEAEEVVRSFVHTLEERKKAILEAGAFFHDLSGCKICHLDKVCLKDQLPKDLEEEDTNATT